MTDPRVPVTLLTGFLGAGKTTLLNAVLSDSSAGRAAVIVNEFGEAGLDHDLIETVGEDVSLMASGCLCCSLKGELSSTINDLLGRRAAGEFAFERIVIETTGLADPAPILQTLAGDRALAGAIRTDGIVAVVDAVNAQHSLDTQFEAVSQVAMTDLIVLSKTDLAAPDALAALESRLRGINASARIVLAVKGKGVAGQIWGLSGLRHDVAPQEALAWTATAAPDPLGNLSGFAQPPATAVQIAPHDARIVSASVTLDKPIEGGLFGRWVDRMIKLRGHQMLRTKGIIFIDDIPKPFVFHGVQTLFENPVPLQGWTGESRQSRVVMIAKDVSERRLRRDLDKLGADSLPPIA